MPFIQTTAFAQSRSSITLSRPELRTNMKNVSAEPMESIDGFGEERGLFEIQTAKSPAGMS